MIVRLWWGAILVVILGLCLLSGPYLVGAYFLKQGVQTLTRGDYHTSIDHFDTALRFDPGNALTYRLLAQAYLQTDNPEQALAAAQQAFLLAPNNPVMHLELGDIFDRLGDVEQAITHYEAGLVGDRRLQLTVNYLQLADRLWAGEDQTGAVTIWRDKVRGIGYSDLYANWRLTRYYVGDEDSAVPYREEVRHFPLESVAPPPDPRFVEYQKQAILGVMLDELWTRETLLNVISYRVWQDQSQSTENILQSLLANNSGDVDLQFYLGEVYYRRGEWQQAEISYRQVLNIDPRYALAYLRLGMIYESKSQLHKINTPNLKSQTYLEEAGKWYQQYLELSPGDLLGLKKLAEVYQVLEPAASEVEERTEAARLQEEWLNQVTQQGPSMVAKQKLRSGWVFLGYRGDEQRLIRGEPAPLWLYWQGPPGSVAGNEEDGWYPLGEDGWIQVLEATNNLIVNGGFELGTIGVSPSGFPGDNYRADPATRKLVAKNRTGIHTTVALLENTTVFTRTSFVSSPVPADPDALYLQTGWMLSVGGGKGYLGRRWIGNNIPRDVLSYSYVVAEVQPRDWQHYASIAPPLSDAGQFEVWLLNFNSTGRVYFDDVMFIKVGKPGG